MIPKRPQGRKANTASHVFVDVDVHVAVDVDGRLRRSGIERSTRMRVRPRARQSPRQRSRTFSPEDNAADRFTWNSTGGLNFVHFINPAMRLSAR